MFQRAHNFARFTCSADGCDAPTPGHYCVDHARWCRSCGEEFTTVDLNEDGQCQPCATAPAELPEIDDNDRGVGLPVAVDGIPRFF